MFTTMFFEVVHTFPQQGIKFALGEHDPGSAQDWRTSNDLCSPGPHIKVLFS